MTPSRPVGHHRPVNTSSTSPEVLIPSLPNDIALNILARVPRRYHPILSAVSKPIRSVVSSAEFFSLRSLLNCTEPLLYLKLRSQSERPADWFVAHGRAAAPDPNNKQSTRTLTLAPVPPIPLDRIHLSSCAVVGPRIYVLGGEIGFDGFSSDVWVLDCRFHTWERGPSMRSPRCYPGTAVLDDKIYVIGGCDDKEDCLDEVLDPVAGRWEAIPRPPETHRWVCFSNCVAMGGRIRVWQSDGEEVRFDPRTQTWDVIKWPERDFIGKIRVVDGALYACNELFGGAVEWFDDRNGKWKEIEDVMKGLPERLWGPKIIDLGGRLAIIIGAETREGNDWTENYEGLKVDLWCAEITVKKNEGGEVVCWEKVLSQSQSDFILTNSFPLLFSDCDCLSVSL